MFIYNVHNFRYLWPCPFSCLIINSVLPSNTICWYIQIWVNMVQLMAWCNQAPSHYLNQCWLIIKGILWCLPERNLTWSAHKFNPQHVFRDYWFLNFLPHQGSISKFCHCFLFSLFFSSGDRREGPVVTKQWSHDEVYGAQTRPRPQTLPHHRQAQVTQIGSTAPHAHRLNSHCTCANDISILGTVQYKDQRSFLM